MLALALSTLISQTMAASQTDNFEANVRPLFMSKCASCHGGKSPVSGLDLSSTSGLLQFKKSGGLSKSSNLTSNPLYKRLITVNPKQQMPPTGDRITKAELHAVEAWITGGAPLPKIRAGRLPGATLWSLRSVPSVKVGSIDHFVALKRFENKVQPNPRANKVTLLRRVTYDLTGLPPTAKEITSFIADTSAKAYERVVARLLNSKGYGEQQARYWLDVVHFGETHGFDKDLRRNDAYRYKHWVVAAFNQDMQLVDFVRLQIAGDVIAPQNPDAAIATGFLSAGPWDLVGQIELAEGTVDKFKTRNLDRDDIVTTTFQTFAGLSVQCARCHDHKFDPITQVDYYQLQSVFAGIERASRPLPVAGKETIGKVGPSPTNGWHSAIESSADVNHWVQLNYSNPVVIDKIRIIPARPTDFTDTPGFGFPIRFDVSIGAADPSKNTVVFDKRSQDYPNPKADVVDIDVIPTAISNIRINASKLWTRTSDYVFALAEVEVYSKGVLVNLRPSITASSSIESGRWSKDALIDGWDSRGTVVPTTYGVVSAALREIRVLARGEVIAPLQTVIPAALSCLPGLPLNITNPSLEGQRRIGLANWLTSEKSPLLWRTMANRIWITHFSRGIVETPNDFGWNGSGVSNGPLLDFLASELRRTGSIKHIHRLIVLSQTYCQSSSSSSNNLSIDRENRFLWRFSPRRLHAEEIRDSILMTAGHLVDTKNEESFDLFAYRDDFSPEYRVDDTESWLSKRSMRRSLYRFMVRSVPIPFFEVFDSPDSSVSVPVRTMSVTPLQSLTLTNHPFVRYMAANASRLGSDDEITRMFIETMGRNPRQNERQQIRRAIFDDTADSVWLAIWNSNGFLTLR